MQSMQRSFGRLLNKGPGNNAKVSVILKDYEDADKVLAKIIDSSKSWRDSWVSLVDTQLAVVIEYEGLYDPIQGATDGRGKDLVVTPELQLRRTFRLKETYAELKNDMLQEITEIDARVIQPATDARDCIIPIRKTIKKRENKRFDYEKSQDKVNKLAKKPGRTPKEDSALAKAEQEMANLADEFHIADDHLRETLPPIINAAFSIIPPLLGCHVLIQNKLLGLYYTFLHNYCDEQGFPSPPPPMEQVIADWSALFKPAQRDVETIPCIARGKAVHMTMRLGDDGLPRRSSTAPLTPIDGPRRSASNLIPGNANGSNGLSRIPSASALSRTSTNGSPQESPRIPASPGFGAHLRATDFTTASVLGQSPSAPGIPPTATRPKPDYFTSQPPASATYSPVMSPGGSVLAKKKPPPPPPPKRIASNKPDEFVVAQFAFAGQGDGDLSFREGDRIRIVKRTPTDQDWWVGEIDGRKGNFPANYCKAL